MEPIVEPYNMFAQQKQGNYPNAAQGANASFDLTKDNQGNYYVGDQKAAVKVFNPSAVPNRQTQTAQNTQPYQPITSMDDLARAMNYTTPEEEDRLRKASVANQRIMAIGDALRHIGNIAHTVNYAPSQQFNNPVAEEQARYERGKALRDKANLTYLTYQQQKAAQDAKQRQWDQQFQLNAAIAASQDAYRQAQAKAAAERVANQKGYYEGQLGLGRERLAETTRNNKERLEETKRSNRVREGQGAQRVKIARDNYELRKSRGTGNGNGSVAALDTPKGLITPSGRSYNNQIQQMWDYAESQGLVKKSDVQRALAEAGFGKETPESVKRQQVMSLLRNNQAMADYAVNRLGWSYGNSGGSTSSTNWDEFAESEDEEDWNDYLVD